MLFTGQAQHRKVEKIHEKKIIVPPSQKPLEAKFKLKIKAAEEIPKEVPQKNGIAAWFAVAAKTIKNDLPVTLYAVGSVTFFQAWNMIRAGYLAPGIALGVTSAASFLASHILDP